ncbi:unnamed protein product [Porites lobata]|uniref:DNA-directed DNA polymerase n=1 Tax=Porites lobata TaxID=104759 RepID=A0ABN8QXH3_9CNID|nr:unnamed protein product [Porites lobata]
MSNQSTDGFRGSQPFITDKQFQNLSLDEIRHIIEEEKEELKKDYKELGERRKLIKQYKKLKEAREKVRKGIDIKKTPPSEKKKIKSFDEYFEECIKNRQIPKDTPSYFREALERAILEYDQGLEKEKSAFEDFAVKYIIQGIPGIENYQQTGSAWYFKEVEKLEIHTVEYNPTKGSSYIPLPDLISHKKAIVNIQNKDEKCFLWCILRYLHPREDNDTRLTDLKKYENYLNTKGISFPMKLKDITKFEKLNPSLPGINGVYPYDYVSSFEKLSETQLPPKEEFFSKLNDEDISDDDYQHAINVWNTFKCKTIRDYHNLYLKSDVLLLSDVFENFRKTCLKHYNLDPAHYYTSPGLAWDACLKETCQQLQLLHDYDMLMMFERGIRGGISHISKKICRSE